MERIHEPLQPGYFWHDYSQGIPSQAVEAGRDKDGGRLFVGRARHDNDILPAKIVPNHGCAYVAYGGKEHSKREYEILCNRYINSLVWRQGSNGHLPRGALPVGKTSTSEALYLGRARVDGVLTPGKVHPSHGICYIPYNGEERGERNYEVLCLQ